MVTKNVCIVGHANSGKTTLVEAMLFKTGVTNRLGSTEKGTSILDYMKYERERKLSVNLSLASFKYNELYLDIIDTPGYLDFQGDMFSGISIGDSVIIVVDGNAGIEFTTERVIGIAKERNIPILFYVSKLGKDGADFYKVYEEIKSDVGDGVLPLTIPVYDGKKMTGIVDLLDKKAYSEKGEMEISSSYQDKLKEYRDNMIESLAEVDMELMEKFIEEKEISQNDISNGLKKGFSEGKVFPVLCGDSMSMMGVESTLKYIESIFPDATNAKLPEGIDSPDGKTVAYVFKTKFEPHVGELIFLRVWSGSVKTGTSLLNNTTSSEEKINQIFKLVGNERSSVDELGPGSLGVLVKLKDTNTSDTLSDPSEPISLPPIEFPHPVAKIAIEAETEKDEEKVAKGLSKLQKSDPTFKSYFDTEAKQHIIESMGEQHIQFLKFQLEENFGVTVKEERPKVHYRETIQKKAEGWAKFKKQTGGRGQFGEVYLRIEPRERGEGVEFIDEVKGGNIPSKFIPSVETGVIAAAEEGFLARYPIIDMNISVYDGSHHPVDSSDNAFQRAGSMALKDALGKASPYLLEPVLKVRITIPDEYTGDVMGDLNSRRGKILGMDSEGKFKVVNAYVPEREMFKYSSQLRSITQGTGTYTSEFAYYERTPENVSEDIIKDRNREEE